ncbi:hypothetical protein K493DRAFT_310597 [Basidiobolus meristosporus CBS 931.73]|uniref:SUZ domain-containing protein n=1 Tax=Basidiobolus meristosporus CBS 931.73 TaxID=1314790 RepID=A0A1Y1Z8P9_9FUNG|nr:hypothetical protein K493DRAFT_310597 [Basidiobolus meristosporus CBS 931.73]|eukprot:ORY06484.1 hypothetical protein K493DRAFT_310597 [Basidiobolus meristosporus CBS 931.73]
MSEEPWDDWEAAEDAGFDPKPIANQDEEKKNHEIWKKANSYGPVEVVHNNDLRTGYVEPVKILRRANNSAPKKDMTDTVSSRVKTMEERKAEYEAARSKIFGTEKSDAGPTSVATSGANRIPKK